MEPGVEAGSGDARRAANASEGQVASGEAGRVANTGVGQAAEAGGRAPAANASAGRGTDAGAGAGADAAARPTAEHASVRPLVSDAGARPTEAPPGAPALEPAEVGGRREAGAHERLSPLQVRLEAGLETCHRWLRLAEDAVLVAIAVVLLFMGVYVLFTGITDLVGSVTLQIDEDAGITFHTYQGHAVVEVAENALLALILAELVGTLLLTIGGRSLTVQPFLIIAIVAVVRHLLLETVKPEGQPGMQTAQLLGLGGLILLLVIALALMQWVQQQAPARPR